MKAEIFTLCEYAKAEPNGKMNIIGTFDSWEAPVLPVIIPMFAVAARLRFDKIEEGNKQLRFTIIDADGRFIIPSLQFPVTINIPPNASTATLPFAGIIGQISLPNWGEYSVDLAVDGHSVGSIPLYVRQLQSPQQGQLPGV